MHGGAPGSGGPKGPHTGNYKHGRYTAEAIASRRWLRQCIRDVRALTKRLRQPSGPSGSAYGEAIYAAAKKPEGEITEVPSYMFPKPGTTTPTFPKVSFVTKVGDLGCGVGYYK
jgi:hypothetical protein